MTGGDNNDPSGVMGVEGVGNGLACRNFLQETDEYLFLDPRAPKTYNAGLGYAGAGAPGRAAGSGRAKRMAFAEGVVFVVGGAGYVEYGNLEEWAAKSGKKLTYGGTEIIDPGRFVGILEELGRGAA
ncbi:hypothetical protein FIBSPDRAFT_888180 [Athelia psychrophila]|uniref:Sec1-like protein n=1 Tax=Athelia psychrophila TaxID=1759441 RepID=A0A166NTW1_9AGAM|nr:hypothetical protein FIBSPDRAFT_888180 [Fibularhizoctonia sp. CBS 109695]